jgi:hypothetical protein
MEANRFTTCAHPSCRCTVETEEPFCSPACADSRDAARRIAQSIQTTIGIGFHCNAMQLNLSVLSTRWKQIHSREETSVGAGDLKQASRYGTAASEMIRLLQLIQ